MSYRPYEDFPISSRIISSLKNEGMTLYTMRIVEQALELFVFRNVNLPFVRISPDIISETQNMIETFEGYDFLKAAYYCSGSSFEKTFILHTLNRIHYSLEVDDIRHYLYNMIYQLFSNHTESWLLTSDDLLHELMLVCIKIDQKIPLSPSLWKTTFTDHPSYDRIRNRLLLTHGNKISPKFLE